MASAFPHQPAVDHAPRERTSVVVDHEEPTDVLQVLSSETAQEILLALRSEPGTASDVADAVDRSVQNVTYHLDRLRRADLITPIETWYSEKGREMTVYALAAERLVVQFSGDEEDAERQDAERQDAERQDAERQDAERQDAERRDRD
ncbi:Helix-turn-helix domain-containing protein [Halopenitus persicus]|uniref:Helix-turn-helix domain-containing protein n=1 Tax=Halopenitus persicus TaxID=1048396 RepID=A0A1H3ERH1_9EURY|nr:winged helix-turn-helix domain-containing protein [Halopenitus persicus]SDX81331.1 Helix-turn-helix domain-containing protein [Halopenitus persicus]